MPAFAFSHVRVALYASSALTLGVVSSVAQGQTSAPSIQEASVSKPTGALEEIVVTARKRAESLQDVPASISALSAGDLAKRFDSDVRDFADSSPNVVIDDTQQGPGGV